MAQRKPLSGFSRTSAMLMVASALISVVLSSGTESEAAPATPGATPTTSPVPPSRAAAAQLLPKGSVLLPIGSFTKSTCDRSVAHVSICSDAAHCTELLATPCEPHGCDAAKTWCNSKCVSNVDCSAGSVCNNVTHQCAVLSYTCQDAFSIIDSSGQISSCAPYECYAGLCKQTCQTANDCRDGFKCVSSSCIPK